MNDKNYDFTFGGIRSFLHISEAIPSLDRILGTNRLETGGPGFPRVLIVCDTNTEYLARQCQGNTPAALCVLESGEERKNWASVETILAAAKEAGLGRDGLFIGIGGGVITDLTGFAASVYMRGASLCLISTTLLGMTDAAMGGKTGFDLFDMKNMAGTFYPASHVYMPLDTLKTLPPKEWKSGMAELIITAVLEPQPSPAIFDGRGEGSDLDSEETLDKIKNLNGGFPQGALLSDLVERAALVKCRVVEADPKETGAERALLNLGHTFGHALESSAGLGKVSHGEAVAWGLVRACELGVIIGVTPKMRAEKIKNIIAAFGYETRAPHPFMKNSADFMKALGGDKKKKRGKSVFVIPAAERAVLLPDSGIEPGLPEKIINGEYHGL
jgi:3-dehydroquinate synthase